MNDYKKLWLVSLLICTAIYENKFNLSSHSFLTLEQVTLKSFVSHYCSDFKEALQCRIFKVKTKPMYQVQLKFVKYIFL